MISEPPELLNFFVAGVSYKKTDASSRSRFAIHEENCRLILEHALTLRIRECFVLSTCNRTEIYGLAENPSVLAELLCTQTEGSFQEFMEHAYIKKGTHAIRHLFYVTAGLDSQVLGDYEVVSQIKQAVKFAKAHGAVGPFLERLSNTVFQSSKKVKNQTALSSGSVSLSFTAVQYLKETVPNILDKKIVVVGAGKFGRSTSKNLTDYLGTQKLTLLNRTEEKARQLAAEIGADSAPLSELARIVAEADVVLVATDAPEPIIKRMHLEGYGNKVVIDLSIPHNVDKSVHQLPNVRLIDIDGLSRQKDETLALRQREVPKAKAIIAMHLAEFTEWQQMRQHAPILKAVKTKLKEMHASPAFSALAAGRDPGLNAEVTIQRILNSMASKIKSRKEKGCYYLEAINEFISINTH